MIRGIGLDVVNVARLKRWLDRPGLLERFFHETELKLLASKGEQAILGLAARFAAKEAFGKALGTGLSGFTLRDICVTNDWAGKPSLTLCGDAGEEFQRRGGGIIFVSLTHEHDYALATVVIEEAPRTKKATGKKTGKKK
jgi:holo-[acyl-carrier protein] synthase